MLSSPCSSINGSISLLPLGPEVKIYDISGGRRNSVQAELWINLLYATLDGEDYFLSYTTVQDLVCKDDTFCLAIFYELDFVNTCLTGNYHVLKSRKFVVRSNTKQNKTVF
mgnify:CR=1 FL=1